SREYVAATTGIYAAATRALERLTEAQASPERGRAVVLDIDETVLDNVAYQAQLVLDDATYASDSWDAWIALRAADAVPGVVDFVSRAQSLGFHVAFITNRACRDREGTSRACPQHGDTLTNLEAIGIDTSETTLMLRGERPPPPCQPLLIEEEQAAGVWSSDKESRRACVEVERDIVMLFGDQLGDFTSSEQGADGATGRDAVASAESPWGTRWFMLPNPTYGDWKPRSSTEKRSLLRGLD
ncbi:MAG: HAD family acid phosphatase, partial [Xanthomonadales bacterium]|nr:HAD family acid phosphatase [Xanthomonadales bacterium]